MKRLLLSLLMIGAALGFQGCIESYVLMKLNSDGSGTLIERTLFSRAMIAEVRNISQSFKNAGDDASATDEDAPAEDTAPADDEPPVTEKDLLERAAEFGTGVKFVEMQPLNNERMTGYVATYAFDDVTKLGIEDEPDMDIDLGMGETAEPEAKEPPAYSFEYTRGNPNTLVVHIRQDDDDDQVESVEDDTEYDQDAESGQDEDMQGEGLEMMKEIFRDMKLVREIQFEDGIVKTDADFVDGNTVTLLNIDFGSLMDNEQLLMELSKMEEKGSEEEVRELLRSIPGLKVELKEKVTVRF